MGYPVVTLADIVQFIATIIGKGQEDRSMALILPEGYDPRLTVRETQEAIKYIRDTFQKEFGREMNLERISAPL